MYGMKVLLQDKDGAIRSWYDFDFEKCTHWSLGSWQEATCWCRPEDLFPCAPHDRPPCGFHAVTSTCRLRDFALAIQDDTRLFARFTVIYALVEGGGEIAVHEEGFRAQYMRIVEIFEALEDLEQAYSNIKEAACTE